MNKDDLITVNTDNGDVEALLISRFNIKGMGDYVLYKIDDQVYGAKYEIEGDHTKLITDLSDLEKDAINEVYSSLEVE